MWVLFVYFLIVCRLGHIYIERYEGRLSKGRANVANVAKVRCQETEPLPEMFDFIKSIHDSN